MKSTAALLALLLAAPALSCDGCYGPARASEHVRNVRRMQPDAQNATVAPKAALPWGQINFLHTTDTHGWLEGHLKEQNYGADWGDYVSFTKRMKEKASQMGVDLLLIDTGDLHDGSGLSDAESPDGALTNPVFEKLDYDLLTIGNHELYLSDIAHLTADQFAKQYGDKYVTSNVKIMNRATGQYEYPGAQYRYFTTPHGLRIMAFGILFDFTGHSNASQVIKAADLIQEPWFHEAVNQDGVDLFILLGHNPARTTVSSSTFGTIYGAIRQQKPDTPIQVFGGHTHIRDFAVYDQGATAIESGRYCETLGWVSMSGIPSCSFNGSQAPAGVPHPTQKAIKIDSGNSSAPFATQTPSPAFARLVYARRYLDWNRLTFAYHAEGSQGGTFDDASGLQTSQQITALRKQLNLTDLYGCAPQTYCQSCKPFLADGNIFQLLQKALATTVVNPARAEKARLIIVNTGSIRFDLVEGPFTFDDSFIVSPFKDTFRYLKDVPYAQASKVLGILDSGKFQKRDAGPRPREPRQLGTRDFNFSPLTGDACVDAVSGPPNAATGLVRRSAPMTCGKHRRQTSTLTPGYTTTDDFGTDGDDTVHSAIPSFPQPNDVQANASFPTDGSVPSAVDLVFVDFIGDNYIIPALNSVGGNYSSQDISLYMPLSFTTNSYLPAYAKMAWQANVPNCPISMGVGS